MTSSSWFIIANPTAGNNAVKKKKDAIINILNIENIDFEFIFSEYHLHEIELVYTAISNGFRNFISIGGDGTLHNIVNGIMTQKKVDPLTIKVGVIPFGTGNDWVKTYNISKKLKKAISIIKRGKTISQDIGKIKLLNTEKTIYFNNLAGIGFDGYVVKTINKYKKLGPLSYLFGSIIGFINYRKSQLEIYFNGTKITTKSLLTLVGICEYSGGGMKLTKDVNTTDNLFDISIAKNFNFITLLLNIKSFFNGKIVNHHEVETFKTSEIKIISSDKNSFIQADGELIGQGGFIATIIPSQINFIIT